MKDDRLKVSGIVVHCLECFENFDVRAAVNSEEVEVINDFCSPCKPIVAARLLRDTLKMKAIASQVARQRLKGFPS